MTHCCCARHAIPREMRIHLPSGRLTCLIAHRHSLRGADAGRSPGAGICLAMPTSFPHPVCAMKSSNCGAGLPPFIRARTRRFSIELTATATSGEIQSSYCTRNPGHRPEIQRPAAPAISITPAIAHVSRPPATGWFADSAAARLRCLLRLNVEYLRCLLGTSDTDYAALRPSMRINAGLFSACLAIAFLDDQPAYRTAVARPNMSCLETVR